MLYYSVGNVGLSRLLDGFDDKTGFAQCVVSFSPGPGHVSVYVYTYYTCHIYTYMIRCIVYICALYVCIVYVCVIYVRYEFVYILRSIV